jgi:hypothetical protein
VSAAEEGESASTTLFAMRSRLAAAETNKFAITNFFHVCGHYTPHDKNMFVCVCVYSLFVWVVRIGEKGIYVWVVRHHT